MYVYIRMLFENWSYFARDDIVCPNKLYLSIHANESPTSYMHTSIHRDFLLDWHSLFFRSFIFFSPSSLSLSFSLSFDGQFWEVCNEMKIVEKRREESVTVPIITAVRVHADMNEVKRHVVKVRRRTSMIILLTECHSWEMKRPEGKHDW